MRRALLATVLAFCALPAGAAAQPRIALFPTPMTQLTPTPPFQPPYNVLPNLFRPPIRSTEVISVGVDASGSVVSVVATQRLVLTRTGDYRLAVPAPATDVGAGPGSESSPGLRTGAIIWAGFAAGRKVLSARATLDPRAAAPLLPLAVTISDGSVRLQNTTGTETATYSADGDRADVAKILDSLRAHPDGPALGRGTYVHVLGNADEVRVRVAAPLRIVGRVGARRIAVVLGGGKPDVRTIAVRGRPSIALDVEPVPPAARLRPPRGRSWTQALRLGALPERRRLFDEAVRTSLTLARVRQYDAFLANPDSLGPAYARYVYGTVAARAPVPASSPEPDAGLAAWALALIAAGSLVAVGGLAVLWSNS